MVKAGGSGYNTLMQKPFSLLSFHGIASEYDDAIVFLVAATADCHASEPAQIFLLLRFLPVLWIRPLFDIM